MKCTTIIWLLACLWSSASAYSQGITLVVKDAPLENVFKEIKKQSGYSIVYTQQMLKNLKKVTIRLVNVSLERALDECLRDQPLAYSLVKKTIVIRLKQSRAPALSSNDSLPQKVVDVKGVVTGQQGDMLIGATVTLKNGNQMTLTDDKGMFEMRNVPPKSIMEITFEGYQKKVIQANGDDPLQVVLEVANNKLDEIQIIAYGTTSRRLNTGDVSTLKSEDIQRQPVANPLLALEGELPGIQVAQMTGFPGSGVGISIRGENNVSGSNLPLYIVDGVPYPGQNLFALSNSSTLGTSNGGGEGNPLSYLNPADIESIDVLKDADATAIYGTLGANGVILITTKKGKAGRTKVDFNGRTGWGQVADKMKLLNTRQYLDMRYEAFKNDGATPNPNSDFDLTLWDTTRQTDWQKQLLGGTSQYTDLQGSVSGGNANTQFLISAGYHRETTVLPGDFHDGKGSVHFNIDNTSTDHRFKISLSGIYEAEHNDVPGTDPTQTALQLPPDAPPVYKPDGSLNWEPDAAGVSTWPYGNPAAILLSTLNVVSNNLVANAVLSYQLAPGLNIKSSFGYANTRTNNLAAIPLEEYDPSTWPVDQRKSIFNDNEIESWIIEPQLTYDKKIGLGVLNVLLGTTIRQTNSSSQSLNAVGFNSDQVMDDIMSATSITVLSALQAIYKYNAGFGRIHYDWQQKYLINLTARRDGSSRFGPANQFHDFWDVGAGWIFSSENWSGRNLSFLSFGKLRGSYGTTGSDDVGDYSFMDLYSPVSAGVPYQGAVGITPTRIYTPNLAWQETNKLEGALDLGFFKDRVTLSSSYYRNRSSNQLSTYSLPAITGFTQITRNLPAVVQNKGWEFELRTVNIKSKNFSWTSAFNLTLNRNLLVSGANGLSAYLQQKVGYSLSTSFFYHFLGVDPITGKDEFADSHGKPTFNPNPATDKIYPVDEAVKYYGGLQNSLTYKGFQLDFLFQFTKWPKAPEYLYNYIPGYLNDYMGANQPALVLNHWQKPGDVSTNQRYSQNLSLAPTLTYAQSSDQAYGDGSFIRLRNLSLSWQLPVHYSQKAHLQNASIFVQGQNLWTITRYKGLDPESVSYTSLPPLRVITVGGQFTL